MKAFVATVYHTMQQRLNAARKAFNRPLTLTEKILLGHLPKPEDDDGQLPVRRKSTVGLRPDRVAMQDATAQMALLQFMHAGMDKVATPSTVHCDHLIQAHTGAKADLATALHENDEVYRFLKTISARYGIGFWEPGSGIIHQVVLENYAFPGGLLIGTDSHTPNGGGLGMLAIGVGGADAVDVMVGEPFGLAWPGIIGVKLVGQLSGWASAKDVILALMGQLTVKGGTGHIVEFFGPGTQTLSCTGKATICNMGAEHGATTSVFPFDDAMARYLRATKRADIAELAEGHKDMLTADPQVLADPSKYYDNIIEIDLSALVPHVVGPHTPDLDRPMAALKQEILKGTYPAHLRYALIGSCTNSSYEDMGRAAHIAGQARSKGLKTAIPLMVTPGSDQIQETIERDGQAEVFASVGAQVLANACGPCIGQWRRDDIRKGESNAILTSYNRNFPGRNDANPATMAFIASPELVTAIAFAGRLDFDPTTDSLPLPDGGSFRFSPPQGDELPNKGFAGGLGRFVAPPSDGKAIAVEVAPESKRLALLAPFPAWDGKDLLDMPVLLQAKGKCTTDHISQAGAWLRFRGHLANISDNMFIGANNTFSSQPGHTVNVLTGGRDESIPAVAKAYKGAGLSWIAVGDENYGEGSSREHAAMSPRFLGGRAILVRSFARIHETNLKKQGLLPLTFVDGRDYELIRPFDRISLLHLNTLAPHRPVDVLIQHQDGTTHQIQAKHTLTQEQLDWFRAGSALNRIAAAQKAS